MISIESSLHFLNECRLDWNHLDFKVLRLLGKKQWNFETSLSTKRKKGEKASRRHIDRSNELKNLARHTHIKKGEKQTGSIGIELIELGRPLPKPPRASKPPVSIDKTERLLAVFYYIPASLLLHPILYCSSISFLRCLNKTQYQSEFTFITAWQTSFPFSKDTTHYYFVENHSFSFSLYISQTSPRSPYSSWFPSTSTPHSM
jgi:hypothetical protein